MTVPLSLRPWRPILLLQDETDERGGNSTKGYAIGPDRGGLHPEDAAPDAVRRHGGARLRPVLADRLKHYMDGYVGFDGEWRAE